ncbi:plasma-membrane proton-e [Malassezia pachydermatis]|uniref:Plasma membrane ATPase n=1 Tax=Malassezia pachydermatis TaxID=77020 RepID=A0A0M8MQC2_9BASI|nr:plasma-membrane proton-e [Malassezia pachydermatis]KOS16208.1 plasma-membrane proton-e [Malassezia pachydermatis]
MSYNGQTELPPPIVAADHAFTQETPVTQPSHFEGNEYNTAPGQTNITYEETGYQQQYSQDYSQQQYTPQPTTFEAPKQQVPMNSGNEKVESGEPAGDDMPADEYGQLVAFIRSQKGHSDEEGQNDGSRIVKKRNWLMPWKVQEVRVNKNGEVEDVPQQVPASWLETDVFQGLNDSEVTKRRQMFGFNELESPSENLFLKFLGFFKGPILYVMELAVALAGGVRDWIDFGVICGILALNAFVGWYQEKQAGDIVAQLKAGIALKATVVRDGREVEIEAREVVPGDIVIVEDGMTVPCDGRIIADYDDKDLSQATAIRQRMEETKNGSDGDNEDDDAGVDKGPAIVACDQSAITGESLAVDKHVGDRVFYTTGCKRGKAYVLATEIAKQSFVGRTAALVSKGEGSGHFQKVMSLIGTSLLVLVIVFVLIIWFAGFFRNIEIARPKENNLLIYTLVFLIIGVPVGLPCVTTTTMAVGAAYLAKREAIVQKLTAIESLAGVDVLCSDKTGTLTANKLSIHEPFTSEGVDVNFMMAVAALASSHNIRSLDPIDKVTISTLKDYPAAVEELESGWETLRFTPFEPVSKRITAEVRKNGKDYVAAKGAPNAILKLCNPPQDQAQLYRKVAGDFASRGFRSLGVAIQEDGKWRLLGLLPMFDPPRSDTAATIAEAQSLGVSVKMLTGDAVAIAKETCRMLSLGTKVYDSQRLIGSGGMAGSAIHDFVEAADGFAEVFPEHKYQVVEMLQHRGHLTAMTGDGVNDAPSLKKADCGIAVEGASDAARAAADVVFLDEGLSTIITSIKVARQIFHRMKAYIQYRISLCIHLEVYLLLSIIILNETIRSQLIVFIALFADVATIAIAYDNAPHAHQPVEWQLPKIWIISVVLGLILAGGTWITRATMFLTGGGIIQNFGNVQEILYLEVALTENWLIFVTRLGGGESDITLPSWQLVGAVAIVDVIATLFCLFGWLSGAEQRNFKTAPHGGWTDIVTVVRVWAYSFGVMVICALVYYIMCRIPALDNLGRRNRSVKNEVLEDFFTNLQRLTLVHEKADDGHDMYQFQTRLEVDDDE